MAAPLFHPIAHNFFQLRQHPRVTLMADFGILMSIHTHRKLLPR